MTELLSRTNIVLLGAGKMGCALLEGWLENGLPVENLVIVDPALPATNREAFVKRGIRVREKAVAADFSNADLLVLAIKPQSFAVALPPLKALLPNKLLVLSIAAGKSIASMQALLGEQVHIIRTMPNTPAAIGQGITAATKDPLLSPDQMTLVEALFRATGSLVWVDKESDINAVTAISGSGPAYFFYFTEGLTQAGISLGLSPAVASQLAEATLVGAGALLKDKGESPEKLRKDVSSPGGVTLAALETFGEKKALEALIKKATQAALARAEVLSEGD